MRHTGKRGARAVLTALAVSLTLSGCTIPFVNIEVPIDLPDLSSFKLPDIKLPDVKLPDVDLSHLDIKPITLPIGVTTSVEEARAQVLSGNQSTLDDSALVMPGYLTVGVKTATSSAPTCVLGDGGRLYGLDIDLGAALASQMGLRVRYVTVSDAAALGTDCDVIMNGTSDNPDHIAIAGTYVESATSFFHKGDPTVVVPTDLGGKSVGLQSGSVSEILLNTTALKMSQKAYDNLNEAFDALEAGEVDYVLCEAYPGAYLSTLHAGISFAGALEAPKTAGVAALASNEALVSELKGAYDVLSSNGVLQGVRTRWVGSMPMLTIDAQIKDVPKING